MNTIAESAAAEAPIETAGLGTFDAGPNIEWLRILVPIDFSNCSRKAIQYAEGLTAKFGGELTLAHVVATYPVVPDLPSATDEMNASLRAEAARKLENWKKEAKHTPCTTVVCSGHPAQEIVREAERIGADMIVIATHGETGIKHAFLGSVAERVARNAPCPILVVREKEHDFLRP